MPELVEQMYCSQQIVIPPKFPYILKRFCKAAIKTQPYDLLRWSFEYFKALAERRPPPVKLRLEYPVYSTEGGLTRGCLKVLANQLSGMSDAPLEVVTAAWQGFCLDPEELQRIFCLCEVFLREESVPVLHFIAVAAGMLTKSLTHTMILLCETLTKEPDGGSAAIPVQDFLQMYIFLAKIDASKDVRYINGFKEGYQPVEDDGEEEAEIEEEEDLQTEFSDDDYWENIQQTELQRLTLINDRFARNPRLSVKAGMPIIDNLERSPSVERARELERANYLSDRREKPLQSEEIDAKLRELGYAKFSMKKKEEEDHVEKQPAAEEVAPEPESVDYLPINVFDEDGNPVEIEYYGERGERSSPLTVDNIDSSPGTVTSDQRGMEEELEDETRLPNLDENIEPTEAEKIAEYVANCYNEREDRRVDLANTFVEIAAIVDRYKSAFYDLGMVAGRQMSTTSGEFIVAHIQKDILAYIDEQIAILPDPDLKKKKAKPEEVAMIRQMLNDHLEDNMSVIVPEVERVVADEEVIPEITVVYAVPGIGPPVEDEMINEFEEYALEACKVQSDVFMPRNIRHFMCPPLEKYVEINYDMEPNEKKEKKSRRSEVKVEEEKCATGGGTIAD